MPGAQYMPLNFLGVGAKPAFVNGEEARALPWSWTKIS
jgi:hypothetical protein